MNISDDQYCIGRGLAAIRTDSANYQTYIIYVLQHCIAEVLKLTSGTTFPNLDGKTLQSLIVPLPPYLEQQRIGNILSNIDQKLEQLIISKKQTQHLKKGLMQKLLTGQWRVNV